MKNIGYLSDTDCDFLTKMVCEDFETTPLGNREDRHGKDVSFISIYDEIDIIIGYFHKFTSMPKDTKSFKDHLTPGIIHNIPMLLLVPTDAQSDAKKIMKDATDNPNIKLVDPQNLYDETLNILKRENTILNH